VHVSLLYRTRNYSKTLWARRQTVPKPSILQILPHPSWLLDRVRYRMSLLRVSDLGRSEGSSLLRSRRPNGVGVDADLALCMTQDEHRRSNLTCSREQIGFYWPHPHLNLTFVARNRSLMDLFRKVESGSCSDFGRTSSSPEVLGGFSSSREIEWST